MTTITLWTFDKMAVFLFFLGRSEEIAELWGKTGRGVLKSVLHKTNRAERRRDTDPLLFRTEGRTSEHLAKGNYCACYENAFI